MHYDYCIQAVSLSIRKFSVHLSIIAQLNTKVLKVNNVKQVSFYEFCLEIAF